MNPYRVFVGAFLQGDLAEQLQALRCRYDPVTAQVAPPHVTLAGTYTRKETPQDASLQAIIDAEAESIRRMQILPGILQPFDLVVGGVRTFPGTRPVVYLNVEVNKGLIEARHLLLSILGMDKHSEFKPHLTLAMRTSWEKSWEMVEELQDSAWNQQRLTFPIQDLQLMVRQPTDPAWKCIHKTQLSE